MEISSSCGGPKQGIVPVGNDSYHIHGDDETREESVVKREDDGDERDCGAATAAKKRDFSHRNKNSKKPIPNNNINSGVNRGYQYPKAVMSSSAGRAPYPPMVRPAAPPYGGGPLPYGYPGSSYGPPPHHYHPHHHPHHPHPMHMAPYSSAPPPPYGGPPHPGAMKGGYHPPPPPPPHYAPPYGMPPSYPHPTAPPPMHPPSYPTNMSSCDSASISSKGSKKHKKRTIDGIHSSNLPTAYAFRRTDSNSSTTSTVTVGNNTSNETNLTEESPHKRERPESEPDLNMDGLMFDSGQSQPPPPPQQQQQQTKVSQQHGSRMSHPSQHVRSHSQSQQQQQQRHVPQQHLSHQQRPSRHRRNYSGASTASTLSVGGFSLSSYEAPRAGMNEDTMMADASIGTSSPKRQKKSERALLVVDTSMRPPSVLSHTMEADQSSRFEQLSLDAKLPTSSSSGSSAGQERNIFLSLSTSPINAQLDVDATPISKNTNREEKNVSVKPEKKPPPPVDTKMETDADRPTDTPTPPVHGELGEREGDDHSMLNKHLRGQSFTPLPHVGTGDHATNSPTNSAFASAIAPQLSWSIAGDTPSMDDLAEWEDHGKLKTVESKSRPSSTTSADTRNMMISPHDFQLWKEEQESSDHAMSGTTTPLPVFFHQSSSGDNQGSENQVRYDHHHNHNHQQKQQYHHHHHQKKVPHHGESEHPYPMYQSSGGHPNMKNYAKPDYSKAEHSHPWGKHEPPRGLPPTPMYATSDFRDDPFVARSPHHSDRRDMEYYPPYPHHAHGGPNDRIRNLRGRVPPGAHLPPMPLHIPPPMSTHLPMTSPMGLGPKGGMWSPHHGGLPPLASPHHMGSPLSNMTQSKRKCMPLKPPIPSKFQGDMDKAKSAPVPEFTSLVNFPGHMSQKQALNLPEGMRCCVMCGQACPCSNGGKGKKVTTKAPGKPNDVGLASRSSSSQEHLGDKSNGYAIIPTQNKGLCTLCDVNVWVVVTSGLEIKWCKGCKNFRPWAAFGDKGLATKCLRCRERQREKYALQKEEKEKARVVSKVKK